MNHASGEARSERFPHLNEAVKAAVETAQFLDGRLVPSPDGILNAHDLAPDGRDGLGLPAGFFGGGGTDPVSQDRPCASEFPRAACDPDGLDRPAQFPQRLPELQVPIPPRTERGRGVVAGIGVDEHGAA